MRRTVRLVMLLALCLTPRVYADDVTPTDDVTTGVIVRASASSTSARIGRLDPGQTALLLGSVPNWYRIQLANNLHGFVPKRWTRVVTTPTPPPAGGDTFTIDVVDVGTGLGILVRGADFNLVYDGGSNDDLARGASNRMLAYLKAVAPMMTTINYMILSHPHRDHVELLPDLFGAYQVREVWDSGRVNDICGYRAFIKAIHDGTGVKYHNALQDFGTKGYGFAASNCYGQALPAETITLNLDSRITNTAITLGHNASMTILHADGAPLPSPNDNTIVVRLDLGSTRVLLMGDAQAGARAAPSTAPDPASIEGALLACCAQDLAARLMIVGHHGSRTSSRTALLDAVGASTFIVSSGPTKYGTVTLPDQDVLTELTARGQVFRTDTNDAACAINPTKIGPDNDGRAGGCDNIRAVISPTSALQVSVWHGAD
jgi:beta-lactamase superfamily II metal-dependent hydrolase